MSFLKMEIAQNKLTTSISEIDLNKKFLLERFIETVALSSINYQGKFVFVYHNIICGTPSSYYIFLLLECNSICKASSLTNFLLPQFQRWSSKVLIKEKKKIHNSWKTIFNRSFNNIYFENIHLRPTKFIV